ncbi:hypothetical protein TNCV_2660291 [Trichonephila clavipes]|uniref:Uncharacterized protein n=1 Tax=Trichonephila clavipes TaxID=2585209 RepID=A0A8X6UUV9_TRICX|nr:hypothetical protein TNCV_2660291 [Trichonephila clavipes]
MNWPLALGIELFPGKDSVEHMAKLRLASDEYFGHSIKMCKMERSQWQKSHTGGLSPSSKCLCVRRVCPIRSRVKWTSCLRTRTVAQ